jgi:N6-L-threonylcarbamoyladenine synthase
VFTQQAHALTPLLTEKTTLQFPLLNILVSGGHTMLVLTTEHGPYDYRYEILAKTIDDSIGDAFDKTAKLLQIPWLEGKGPGPSLEAYAQPDPSNQVYESIPRFRPPIPKEYAFSYAGLKSSVERQTAKLFPNLKKPIPREIARAMARRFQEAAVQQIIDKTGMVLDQLEGRGLNGRPAPIKIRSIAASGGVASNSYLRAQ